MQIEYQSTCKVVNKFICYTQPLLESRFVSMDKYGKRLVAARKYANNMTQQELSAKLLEKFSCKLTQQAISHLESECNDAGGSEYTAQISSICGIDDDKSN